MRTETDEAFLDFLADALAGLPGVRAVSLGGSRTQGTAGPQADWDLAVYYRGRFDPADLRALGWPGEVSELGGWGGGVFNGGAWLSVQGRAVDVHYRDLEAVEAEIVRAEAGEVSIEPLMFHLAGIPTYVLLAEIALGRVLRGALPPVTYPAALRRAARAAWWSRAEATLGYAVGGAVHPERRVQVLGLLAQGALCTAHAVCAARGVWVTNEKRLLATADLGDLTAVFEEGGDLEGIAAQVTERCRSAADDAMGREL